MKRAVLVLLLLAIPRLAAAGDLTCPLSKEGTISVDGMLDDWADVAPARAGGKDKDASYDVRCTYDGKRLAISVDVRDDVLTRIFKAKGKKLLGEDRVEVKLQATGKALTFLLFPGNETNKPRRLAGGIKGKKAPKWLLVEDTQQPKGWSIELELPLAKIAGWSASAASLAATITFHDADSVSEKRTQESIPSELTLGFGDSAQLFARFLKDTGLKKKDVTFDQMADVDPSTEGDERVVAGGTVIGLLAERYAYAQLPVDGASDVLEVQLAGLRGDASRQVLARVRQRGNGGSRDLLVVFGGDGGQLAQLFAIELRKEADGNRLDSTLTVAKAGTRRKLKKGQKVAGHELVIEARPAVGWDEDTFEEVPADDAEPIHLPWDLARTGGVYWLDGDTLRSQAITAKK